jgi:hypothetical protein
MTNTTKQQLNTTLRLLKKARGFIASGWVKEEAHVKVDGQHQYCMLGGVNRAATGRVYADTEIPAKAEHAVLTLAQVIARKQRVAQPVEYNDWRTPEDIVTFNDADRRKQDQVLDVFDTAIAKVEKALVDA